ncbi:GNAT family N-acetyltransferase [Candidatus Kirkpatrickella diaphorinae]|uniref:GNAT family N-acetyltransferase n=1 Tax=Candidatus Kirkpatrickella diaphorinae TaxID=2984322 RepID=A0ABY6GJ84_9PROT|nr:GNAT family N-acetyltransferase [Candidatus Kirkpatrickella diaphorinae]UYH51384.1 GNAT family N-acetyltransferase [Candidatus Kirkpatrickella diaphorinae]
MSQLRTIRTQRLFLRPVSWHDLADLRRLKGNAASFGRMLGGVRTPGQVEAELAEDMAFWARRKIGIFAILEKGVFVGLTGFHERPDGRGIGLRFALFPHLQGRGLAREAAGAALSYARTAGIHRVIAVASADNLASQTVLRSIGMRQCEIFQRDGREMRVYEAVLDHK